LEICAVELDSKSYKLITLCLHKHLQILINFFITITEKFNIQQTEKGRCYFNSKRFISWKHRPHPQIKKITEAEIKSKILNVCASLINHPLSYIENHVLHMSIFSDCLKITVVKPLYKEEIKLV